VDVLLPRLGDRSIERLLRAERAVLILSRSDCAACRVYERDVRVYLRLGVLHSVAIGRLVIDAPGGDRFKHANPWVTSLHVLPFTVLYRRGQEVELFAAAHASFLVRRIQSVFA